MKRNKKLLLTGFAAGAVNGMFGAGGGMVLVPLLSQTQAVQEAQVFSSSVSILLPVSVVSLLLGSGLQLPIGDAWPYALGGAIGGVIAAWTARTLPLTLLHRLLGALILVGGFRYLW